VELGGGIECEVTLGWSIENILLSLAIYIMIICGRLEVDSLVAVWLANMGWSCPTVLFLQPLMRNIDKGATTTIATMGNAAARRKLLKLLVDCHRQSRMDK
jgi:hypothetical protein